MRRLSLFGAFMALLLSATPSAAAPIIIGSPANPSTGNGFPFGQAYVGDYQQVYTGSAFPGPITITGLQFYNTAYNSSASAMNWGQWTISLSTTERDWNTLSPVYTDNLGADNTMVFSGNLYRSWTFGDTLAIALTTPFVYDPADGNLLMDVVVPTAWTMGGSIYFDVNGKTTDNTTMGRVYSTGGWDVGQAGYGLVTGFETPIEPDAPIPEPASLFLFGTGLVGVARGAWRKRRG